MKKMLDVGCGPGTLTNLIYYNKFHDSYRVYGIDIDKNNIITISKKWPNGVFHTANAEKIPFRDNFFDLIMSRHVFEHVKNIDTTIDEIYRVCKRGGIIYIAVPTRIFEKTIVRFIPNYMGHHHERVFLANELENRLRSRGFIFCQRRYSKWPMFIMILFLAYVSQFTRYLFMEMQTGVYKICINKERKPFFSSKFQSGIAGFILIFLDRIFNILNNYIPWEMEITAIKK